MSEQNSTFAERKRDAKPSAPKRQFAYMAPTMGSGRSDQVHSMSGTPTPVTSNPPKSNEGDE